MELPPPSSTRRRAPGARRLAALGAIVGTLLVISTTPVVGTTAGAAPAPEVASACPSAITANDRFVAFLFQEILRRCPDAGAAQFWRGRLDGGASRWSVAESIDMSTENLGRNNVDGLYRGLLGRAPSSGERAYWIAHIRRAHENGVPTAALLASQEGYARHTTAPTAAGRDEEWLTVAYARILDRAPDPAGAAYYRRRLGTGGSTRETRMAVAVSLERSAPNADSWVRASMTEALGRTPDPAGIRSWTAWLTGPGRWQTFRLWTLLLSSDEAYRRSQR